MLFGIPLTNCGSENTFGCANPGFTNSSNDNTRPTADRTFPLGGGDGDTCVVDVVCESVFVSEALVGAVPLVADAPAVGASLVSVLAVGVASEFGTEFGVGAVTGEDWIVGADMVEAGLSGLTGDIGLVGLFIDFLQVSDVVTQGCHVGLPYGSGHVEERVWVMLPV
jgi:hypothetical protein